VSATTTHSRDVMLGGYRYRVVMVGIRVVAIAVWSRRVHGYRNGPPTDSAFYFRRIWTATHGCPPGPTARAVIEAAKGAVW
jgi:hypothetical protein